jgi:hypothetical protein
MKTQFKHHIKFGSCWYDNFFKVSTRQIQIRRSTSSKTEVDTIKQLKTEKNENKN